MAFSKLICASRISPFRNTPRNHKIDTITIHCTAGQMSVDGMLGWFQVSNSSCNYGIANDGRIVGIVDENDRSWCSSSPSNDNRAITIECASDTYEPCKINDCVYKSLIKLLVDICKRNNIKKLLWKNDKSLIGQVDKQNMTVHRWFEPEKGCPGEYIFARLGQIANEVNAQLVEVEDMTKAETEKIAKEMAEKIYNEKNPVYNTIDEVPKYWREDIQDAVNRGIIAGVGNGKLGLTRSEAKAVVIVKRAIEVEGK